MHDVRHSRKPYKIRLGGLRFQGFCLIPLISNFLGIQLQSIDLHIHYQRDLDLIIAPWILSLEISSFWIVLTSNSFSISVLFSVSESCFFPVSFEELKYRPPDMFPVISFLLSFSLHNEESLIMLSRRRTESTSSSFL